jgi:hypothetical protein
MFYWINDIYVNFFFIFKLRLLEQSNNKKQLLCSNNLSLEMKKKLTKNCIWSVALYGSETWTLGKKMEGRKCIWNMVLEKNVKNKKDTQNNEWLSFPKGERRKIIF